MLSNLAATGLHRIHAVCAVFLALDRLRSIRAVRYHSL